MDAAIESASNLFIPGLTFANLKLIQNILTNQAMRMRAAPLSLVFYASALLISINRIDAKTSFKSAALAVRAAKPKKTRFDNLIRIVVKEHVDANKDGKISFDECYALIMRLYALMNQQVPIKPPSQEKLRRLFGGQEYTSVAEFQKIAATLASRAGVRYVAHQLVSCVVAPVVALKSVDLVGESKALQSATPDAIQSKPILTAVFMVTAVKQFGNWFLKFIDWLLDTFEPFRKLMKLREDEENVF